ncbi:MAG: hypothetical protein D6733_04985 [Methanobacteriota archaeon]|nr:MAG: hypothetical protein D6733_04985 [Euryarchaeota archaeon]
MGYQMERTVSKVQIIVFAVVVVTIAAGFLSLPQREPAAAPLQDNGTAMNLTGNVTVATEYASTPAETFTTYSQLISNGSYDDAISLVVVTAGGRYQRPSPHTEAVIKGEMTSAYGAAAENFEILRLDITGEERLDEETLKGSGAEDGVVLSYTMRYSLGGRFGVLSEKATVVGIDGQWWVVYPGQGQG